MRLGRATAILLALMTMAAARPMQVPELSTESLAVNGPAPKLDFTRIAMPPFRCDSLQARDCFEMFQRHQARASNTTVAVASLGDHFEPAEQSDTIACGVSVTHRGDRCLVRARP